MHQQISCEWLWWIFDDISLTERPAYISEVDYSLASACSGIIGWHFWCCFVSVSAVHRMTSALPLPSFSLPSFIFVLHTKRVRFCGSYCCCLLIIFTIRTVHNYTARNGIKFVSFFHYLVMVLKRRLKRALGTVTRGNFFQVAPAAVQHVCECVGVCVHYKTPQIPIMYLWCRFTWVVTHAHLIKQTL